MMTDDFEDTLRGLPVLVTGHTGFTGGWLCMWLSALGCKVTGLSLAPETKPSLFEAAGIEEKVTSVMGDIRDIETVKTIYEAAKPVVVFHLAAQPLVGRAFDMPCDTIATNVLGTAHVLEAARMTDGVKAVVCITTDKVYSEAATQNGYVENDRLGGKDPYSASKACAELIAAAYAQTLNPRGNDVKIATARGGNIIGGGDWSAQRIVPDFMRAMEEGKTLYLRNPDATRPWQHVLALVHGYLILAARLLKHGETDLSWNFGPDREDEKSVRMLVDALSAQARGPKLDFMAGTFPEAPTLRLDSSKARTKLGWKPPLDFNETVRLTAEWYHAYRQDPASADAITLKQLQDYRRALGLEA